MLTQCDTCGSHWLDAEYDYPAVAKQWRSQLSGRERTLWRYQELFPVSEQNPAISMGEGATPLFRLYQYEQLFNHAHLYVKDERQGPTSSFKDRQAVLAVTAMYQAGIRECVLASAGNAGVAYAAYCARAGIKLWLFVSSLVLPPKMREAALYGAKVVKVSGTYDETKSVAAAFAGRKGIYLDQGAKFLPGKESMKTLAFEIAEQLGLQQHPDYPGRWQAPDWYLQAVSGGIGPLGVWKGFWELREMGFIDKLPRLGIVQVAGCAPMVEAFRANKAQADPVVPTTLITVLATGNPGLNYVQLREAVLSNGGTMVSVDDGEAFQAMRNVARQAGVSVEPAAAVAFAGLEKLLTDGTIQPDQSVVVNCSGHTFPVEGYILSEQHVLNLKFSAQNESVTLADLQEEGLSSAFHNLEEQITSILLVDDNASDRRLVRRLIQRHKRYRIYEAENGIEGLKMARDYKPDLIVTDLTMPEMDGFTFLEKLKSNPDLAAIPVVVVSAKSLTPQEHTALTEYSKSVWTKGDFDTHHLADHVVALLGDTPIGIGRTHPTKSLVSPQKPSRNHTIVIIDDNARDRRLTRRLLESTSDYQIIEGYSGQHGLQAIMEHKPDLVLLDLMMPDMDGFAILKAMQQDELLAEIPVIVVSAKELTADERAHLQHQIRTLVTKASIDRKLLLETIERTLTQK
jgi:threonine synthase